MQNKIKNIKTQQHKTGNLTYKKRKYNKADKAFIDYYSVNAQSKTQKNEKT